MATKFDRPSLAELLSRVKGDIETKLDGVTARLRRTFEFAIAGAVAGVADSLHGHLVYVANQIIPDTMAERFLLKFGATFGIFRKAEAAATGTLAVTGTGTIPAGTQYVRVADGVTYSVDAEVVISVSGTVALTADDGAGVSGNMDEGQKLQLITPISGIDSVATVDVGGLTGGADIETLPAFLERVLDRIQRPPLGGAPGNHRTWALEVSGVTRAWEFLGADGIGNPGLGKVAVAFVLDAQSPITPTSAQLQEMQEYLDARSPFEVFVFAPTLVAFDWEDILNPNGDATVEAAVDAEVADMLLRDAEPGGTIYLSRLDESISAAAGEVSHELVSPVADQAYQFGELPVLGTGTHSAS